MAEALYRKYRPQVFADVVGQDHIVRTLQNAVEQGKVSHAYLFCGPRGTGKTTMARLLSKALLCQLGAVPNPDGTCEGCKLIAAGSHPDVYELDAASRTGVENVREEIIGRVQFAPTRGASKVYIIDEVHMLSTAAFNALLKTLEEPPSHVVFVLCTTDPQKVPETIHSRCQRFDFRRIGQEGMVAKLGAVCVAEGAQFEGEALELVAHRAEGGMRNALTTLEQLIAFSGGNVTMAAAEDMLGGLDSSDVAELVAAIGQRDASACFTWVARYVETGGDLAQFTRDLAEHVRNLYVMSLAGADAPLDASDAMRTEMARELQWFGSDRLARALCVLGDLTNELKTSTNARLSFEIACVRLTRPASDLTLESLAERIENLERNGVVAQPQVQPQVQSAQQVQQPRQAQPAQQARPQQEQPAQQARTQQAQPVQEQRPQQVRQEPAAQQRPVVEQRPAAQQQVAAESKAASVAQQAQATQQKQVAQPIQQAQPAQQAQQSQPAQQAQPAEDQGMAGGNAANGGAWEKAAQNPAALQRLWQQVMASLKKDKGPYAVLFMNTRVSFDAQRQVLCVEFPKEAAFAFKAVQKPEVSESLTAAITATLGVPAPFCYVQTGGAKAPVQGAAATAARQQTQAQPAQQRAQQVQQARPAEEPRREQPVRQEQPVQQARPAEQPRQQQPRREQPRQVEQRPRVQQQPVDSGYDEVPLDIYDGFAAPVDDRYDDYGAYEPEPRREMPARQARPAQGANEAGAKQAAQKPWEAYRQNAASQQPAARTTEPNPEADAAWQGNLEDAFGSVSVQRM